MGWFVEIRLLEIEARQRASVTRLFYDAAVEGSSSSAWMSPNFFSL